MKAYQAVLIGTIVTVVILSTVIVTSLLIPSHGTIFTKAVNCALYFDIEGTQPVTAIDWGINSPSSTTEITLYIKNTGNSPCNFTVTTDNWNPQISENYVILEADLFNITNVPPNIIVPVLLTQSIIFNAVDMNYSYTIIFTAIG